MDKIFCSFACPYGDNSKAQYAACLAFNGVYCTILEKVIEKGSPCQAQILGKYPDEPDE